MDWLFDRLLDFLVPKTPWKVFVCYSSTASGSLWYPTPLLSVTEA